MELLILTRYIRSGEDACRWTGQLMTITTITGTTATMGTIELYYEYLIKYTVSKIISPFKLLGRVPVNSIK